MRIFSSLLLFLLCHASPASILFGTIKPVPKDKVLILKKLNYETRRNTIIDTLPIAGNGFFLIGIELSEPTFYSLGVSVNDQLLPLILKPNDTLEININNATISCIGSVESQLLINYEKFRIDYLKQFVDPIVDSVNAAYDAKDKIKTNYWNNINTSAIQLYKTVLKRWAMQPAFIQSFAAVHHSLRWDGDKDSILMDSTLFYLKKNYATNTYTTQIENKIIKIKRIRLGAVVPNFTSIDSKGNIFKLNEVKGNYILLDFWASWCGPCRKESPSLVKAYQNYKEKGFEIISISLDDKESKWKKAITKDHYTWTNISELNGWESLAVELYSVGSIPSSFLLDKDGKIIAKNLRGAALEEKLVELFK